MASKPLLDLSLLDPESVVFSTEEIRLRNPHRFEMEMLDRIIHVDWEAKAIVGVRRVRDDEFWVRGHFPGRPVLPGIVMIETAAQLVSFYFRESAGPGGVLGFAAGDEFKFRGIVKPGDLLLVIGKVLHLRKGYARFATQGFVSGNMVFEGVIVGMTI